MLPGKCTGTTAASSFEHCVTPCISGPAPTTGVQVVVTGNDTGEPTGTATSNVFSLYIVCVD